MRRDGAARWSCSFMDLFAGIISIAPALAFALSGTSAFPGVLAFAGSEPVLRLVDVAVNHELSGMLISLPVISVHWRFIWEHFTKVLWESFVLDCLGVGDQGSHCNKHIFHYWFYLKVNELIILIFKPPHYNNKKYYGLIKFQYWFL